MKVNYYTWKIVLSIVLSIGVTYAFIPDMYSHFLEVKEITLLVCLVFFVGVVFDLIRIAAISSKTAWVDGYKVRSTVTASSIRKTPKELEDIPAKITPDGGQLTLEEYYLAVKSCDVILSHKKDAGKFLTKICFMTGFLGAFICIIIAVGDIAHMFSTLDLNLDESVSTLAKLQQGLAGPLEKLKTSFSISILGIFLSCLLSYVDRQAFMAESKFLIYVESWLLSCTDQKSK